MITRSAIDKPRRGRMWIVALLIAVCWQEIRYSFVGLPLISHDRVDSLWASSFLYSPSMSEFWAPLSPPYGVSSENVEFNDLSAMPARAPLVFSHAIHQLGQNALTIEVERRCCDYSRVKAMDGSTHADQGEVRGRTLFCAGDADCKDESNAPACSYTVDLMLRNVCVFCGSNRGQNPTYANMAERMGHLLSERGLGLVYGGGKLGLMGVLTDACLDRGGRVIGVMPKHLAAKEIAHRNLTELHLVDSMHQRKALMADLSDAFIAMPGGYETWEEFCEVLTWSQLGIHGKTCALLNINGYYDPLLAMADRAVSEGFLRPVHRKMLLHDEDPGRLLHLLATCTVPIVEKWIDPSER